MSQIEPKHWTNIPLYEKRHTYGFFRKFRVWFFNCFTAGTHSVSEKAEITLSQHAQNKRSVFTDFQEPRIAAIHSQDACPVVKHNILPCNQRLILKTWGLAIEIALENNYHTWSSREEIFMDRYFIVTGNTSDGLYAEQSYCTEWIPLFTLLQNYFKE